MQLRTLLLATSAVAGAFLNMASAATTTPKYYCDTDADCTTNFPDTVCIEVDSYGEITKKCTPNTKDRPACLGTQPGLCPSYQSEEIGYLNVHCVFVAKDSTGGTLKESAASGSGSAANRRGRYLMMAASSSSGTVKPATVGSSDSSKVGDVTVSDGSGATTTAPATVSGDLVKVTINNKTVTGQFKCVDVSDCENQAYDTSLCSPSTCGSPNSKQQCNTHGTCTYPSIQTMNKRSCMCYAGYGGDKCQTELSDACDVDCGLGGDCVDSVCKCKKGFDGASYKGKKGKANQRCTKCTNDLACQNDNSCDIETGSCVCAAGYSGTTCGATEDSCTKKDCGTGNCKLFGNGSAACYCPICQPDCTICAAKDCSTCPSPASTITTSKFAFLAAVAALVAANLVM